MASFPVTSGAAPRGNIPTRPANHTPDKPGRPIISRPVRCRFSADVAAATTDKGQEERHDGDNHTVRVTDGGERLHHLCRGTGRPEEHPARNHRRHHEGTAAA
ncbi:hypothetical protein DPEC_G00056780 [Dallia pectoralis]|uniref:Uncharacterized protein n=1 Tax=Dallia pectoralis TaxID=75939 RepID=A0ACC2H5P9_DALPE|nr:hypothetical protein DPEC_G00056780 [Dallia pectoralis]